MGVLSTISRVFGGQRSQARQPEERVIHWDGPEERHAADLGGAGTIASLRPKQPIEVEAKLQNGEAAGSDADAGTLELDSEPEGEFEIDVRPRHNAGLESSPPKRKQEMLAELHRNYQEVLGLVRKVDDHLDRQDERSARMLELAERLPEALDSLSAIRRQHGELASAVADLATSIREGNERTGQASDRQLESLTRIQGQLESAGELERELNGTLNEFRASVTEISGSTDRLGGVLNTMQSREADREDSLRRLVERSQRWMLATVVLCLIAVAAAVTVGAVVLLR